MEVKELDSYWKCKVKLELSWFENRLGLQNLRPEMIKHSFNEEERKLLWLPAIEFGNTEENSRIIVDDKAVILAKKHEEKDETDCCKSLRNSEIFYGDRNPIVYQRIYTTKFLCNFNLRNFPFDTHQCTIELTVAESQRSSVELFPADFLFSAPTELSQFEILEISKERQGEGAIFIITFRRKLSYHLFSVFIPSICLLVISLTTMIIRIDHLMIQIPTMLVIYTFFQAISISLPKTAYIKLLDIWLLFGLILPFASFVLNIIEQICKDHVGLVEEFIKVIPPPIHVHTSGSNVTLHLARV